MNRSHLILVVLAGFALWVGVRQYGNQRASEALSHARADSLATVQRSFDSTQNLRRQDSVRWSRQDARRSREVALSRLHADSLGKDAATLSDSLSGALARDSSVSDSLRRLVTRTVTALTATRDTLLVVVAQQDTVILGLRHVLAQRDSSVSALTALNLSVRHALNLERKRGKSSGFGCVGGVGGLATLAGTVNAGVGVICGKRF